MENISIWGTLVNTLAVVLGSLIGLGIRYLAVGKKKEKPGTLSDTILKGLALCVMGIGVSGVVKASVNGQIKDALEGSYVGDPANPLQLVQSLVGEETLVIVLSMAIGSILGYLLRLDDAIQRLGNRLEKATHARFGNVARGFVSAALLFCVGSMTVVGALNSGLFGDHSMLYTKSILDLVSSILLSISMGIGVLFSAGFVLVFEGAITLLAQWIAPYLTDAVVTCMSGVGSLLIIGLALNVLGATKLKIMNYIPAIFLPIALIPLQSWIYSLF